jgi:hypothetical protein
MTEDARALKILVELLVATVYDPLIWTRARAVQTKQ